MPLYKNIKTYFYWIVSYKSGYKLLFHRIVDNRRGISMKKIFTILALLVAVIVGVYSYVTFFDHTEAKGKQKTIMAFGDSLTYGKGDRKEQGYVGQLQKELNEKHQGTDYQILNYGVVNRESSGVLKQLGNVKTADHLNETDYFIVFIGTNDLIHSNGGDLSELHPEKMKAAKEDYLDNMNAILKILQTANKNAPVILLGLYNPYPEGHHHIEKYIDDWNQSIQKLAASHENVKFISTNELFKGKNKKQYFSDSLHLDDDGYRLIAGKILKNYDFK